jgi:hypothetical protein
MYDVLIGLVLLVTCFCLGRGDRRNWSRGDAFAYYGLWLVTLFCLGHGLITYWFT